MTNLSELKCTPCEGGVEPLNRDAATALMAQLDDAWTLDDDARAIRREYRFKAYKATIAFVNAVAWIAEQQGHHPDLTVGYGRVGMTWTTHAIDGLSRNDFICAARVDALFA